MFGIVLVLTNKAAFWMTCEHKITMLHAPPTDDDAARDSLTVNSIANPL